MLPTTLPSTSSEIGLVQHEQVSAVVSNWMEAPAFGGTKPDKKKSAGGLWPHALIATTLTQALNPAGKPLALTDVLDPTFAGAYKLPAPGVVPAETR
jgi:hypothetical protein